MRKLFFLLGVAILPMLMLTTSCNDDVVEPGELRSRFTPSQDPTDPLTWIFTNASINAVSYAWTFGDGGTSTEESPTHTYASEGDYDVSLTVTGADGATNTSTQSISVVDPSVELKKLTGETSKTWKLLREVDLATGSFPVLVGPADRSQIWFALGRDQSIGARPCLMEEEYIFSFNGDYEYKPKNNLVWAEEGVWAADLAATCVDATVGSNMVNVDGADISAWGPGTFTFDFNVADGELTLNGLGAHVGLTKVGTDAEFLTPQLSVTYRVVSLETDDAVDVLVLETDLPAVSGYWSFTLVSYDNPADEPPLPSLPEAVFSASYNGLTATFNNTSINTTSYVWDFGDGNTSTETSPTHTYSIEGVYTVTLTATGPNGTDVATSTVVACSSSDFTAADLHGGSSKTWKLFAGPGALQVGPSPNDGQWFSTSLADVTEGRVCQFDDTWTFDNAGGMVYNTFGDVFGEPYMGVEFACVETSSLSGGAEAWGDGTHSFTTTDSGPGNGTITVIGDGAFIGLSKVYNGGEYASPPSVFTPVTYDVLCYFDNGTDEIIVLTIDVTSSGGAWWTFVLQAE